MPLTVQLPSQSMQESDSELRSANGSTNHCEIIFKDIRVTAAGKTILNDVNGIAKPAELLAIIGPSGAGKTTLLNCLAGRIDVDSGQILINSRAINKQLRRKISYVLQQDIFLANLTCWQTIWYTALLRLPGSMPTEDKKKRVYEIIDGLSLRKCLQTVIGDNSKRGLSGGEKKRTSIACELLTDPQIMLLDEPTSGLDSSTAHSLCRTLKNYAKVSRKTVIVSIHQPSSQIFNLFDRVLLLCDGQTAFYGDIAQCTQHFIDLGLPCPSNYNLADHMLDQVTDASGTKAKILEQAPQIWGNSEEQTAVRPNVKLVMEQETSLQENVKLPNTNGHNNKSFENDGMGSERIGVRGSMDSSRGIRLEADEELDQREHNSRWPTSFQFQFSVLARRYFGQTWPILISKLALAQILFVSFISAVLWFQIEPIEATVRDRVGRTYFTVIHLGFVSVITGSLTFPRERMTLNKERLGGYYRLSAYYLAKTAVDIPLFLVAPVVHTIITFWASGISYNFGMFVQYLLIVCLFSLAAYSLGCFYGAAILDINTLVAASNVTMVCMTVASGFFVTLVPVWAAWLKYVALLTYAAGALIMLDFRYADITCAPMESAYNSCANQTMFPRNNTFLPLISKKELMLRNTIADEGFEIWHCVVTLAGLCIVLNVLAYISLRFIRKPRIA